MGLQREEEQHFDKLHCMETLCTNMIQHPTSLLLKRIHDFVRHHAPVPTIPKTQTYYILYEGTQYFDRHALERLYAWDEVEVVLTDEEIVKFVEVLDAYKTFNLENPAIENAIRNILRTCNSVHEMLLALPNCAHKHLTNIHLELVTEAPEGPLTDLLKQRVVQLMILFPNL